MCTAGAIPFWGFAQYPEKPITLFVGYGAGSAGDQIARGLAAAASKRLRQPILVVNRPSASGTHAISEALSATPDGYTLGTGTPGTLTVQPHLIKLSYGPPETYVPVAKLVATPNVLLVRAGGPWVTVDAAVAAVAPIEAHLRAGKAIALGVFYDHRLKVGMSGVPTFKERGFEILLTTGQAVVAPHGTPASNVRILDEMVRKAVAEPSFVSLAERTQNTIDYKGPEEFAAELR